jgi:hypothetical protein
LADWGGGGGGGEYGSKPWTHCGNGGGNVNIKHKGSDGRKYDGDIRYKTRRRKTAIWKED